MKKIYLHIIFIIFLSFVVITRLRAHAPGFSGKIVSAPILYDLKYQAIGSGVGVNGVLVVINGGVEYRHWFSRSTEPSKFDAYLGLGLGPVLQIQKSLNTSSIRLRSDLILLNREAPFFPDWNRRCLAISIYAEQLSTQSEKSLMIGIGVGMTF